MLKRNAEIIRRVLEGISGISDVVAVGYSGDESLEARPAEADVDAFVFCERVPDASVRTAAYRSAVRSAPCPTESDAIAGGPWGIADHLVVDGVDLWAMFFTADETMEGIEATLRGERLESEGEFFPTGRLATLLGLHVVADRFGFLASVRSRIFPYPIELKRAMVRHHLPLAFDEEDFDSAVRRRDVLFYHAVLDRAIEHFLQALFAMNGVYLPSRKRSEAFIGAFARAPERCVARIREAVAGGASEATLADSMAAWRGLVESLARLAADIE